MSEPTTTPTIPAFDMSFENVRALYEMSLPASNRPGSFAHIWTVLRGATNALQLSEMASHLPPGAALREERLGIAMREVLGVHYAVLLFLIEMNVDPRMMSEQQTINLVNQLLAVDKQQREGTVQH